MIGVLQSGTGLALIIPLLNVKLMQPADPSRGPAISTMVKHTDPRCFLGAGVRANHCSNAPDDCCANPLPNRRWYSKAAASAVQSRAPCGPAQY